MVLIMEIILAILFFAPRVIGIKTYIVTSGSMEPLYPTGSLLYVKKIDARDIKKVMQLLFIWKEAKL